METVRPPFPFAAAAFSYIVIGPYPAHDVVVIAVRNAVSAATSTFTATSIILFFFILEFCSETNTHEYKLILTNNYYSNSWIKFVLIIHIRFSKIL